MLSSRQLDGLLGLDRSFDFASSPLNHVFLVIHGLGDQYSDAPPWLTAFETSLAHLQRGVNIVNQPNSARTVAPAILLAPLEYHTHAQRVLTRALRPAAPRVVGPVPAVRTGISETVGDVLMAASPHFRNVICRELQTQATEQLAAVRRARPAYTSGRFSIFAHSTGAIYAMHMLATGMLDEMRGLDAVVLAGGPVAAYATLDPLYADQLRSGIAERRNRGIRIVNVYHPLDPVSYRMQPWLAAAAPRTALTDALPAVRVGQVDKVSIWDEVRTFWDDTIQNVMSTLFPNRVRELQHGVSHEYSGQESSQRRLPGSVTVANLPSQHGAACDKMICGDQPSNPSSPLSGQRLDATRTALQRDRSYLLQGGGADGQSVAIGEEALVGEHVDFELQDGMEAHSIDVVTNFAAVKAHGFYWRSQDVARILVDISRTSKPVS